MINNTEILCVTDMYIRPAALDKIEIKQTICTQDLEYGYQKRIVIKTFETGVDYEITGITVDGKNVSITFHDPKDFTIKYEDN